MRAPTCGGFTPSPNPRDVSRARQRRSTWLGKLLPISRLRFPSCWKGGRDRLPYSCGTAPDSNRLRLFSPGIRTMGTPDVQYSVSDSIQAGAGPVQMRLPREITGRHSQRVPELSKGRLPLSNRSSFGILWAVEAESVCRRARAAESERRSKCRYMSISAWIATTGSTGSGQRRPRRRSIPLVRRVSAIPRREQYRRLPFWGDWADLCRRKRARPAPSRPERPHTRRRNRSMRFRPTVNESASRADERARPFRCSRLLLG